MSPSRLLVASFAAIILVGTLLLATPWAVRDGQADIMTALFTATSATCITGLVTVDTATHWTTFGHIIIMLLVQVGGLGVMSFATFFAFLFGWKIQLRQRLAMQQAMNYSTVGGVVKIFRYLLLTTFTIEALAALILAIHWTPTYGAAKALWFGLFHSISAFNNAGFDLFGNFRSLTAFTTDVTVNLTLSTLLIAGGLGFMVLYELFRYRQDRILSLHSKVVLITTAILILGGTAIILITEYQHALQGLPLWGKVMAAYFQTASARTAGFVTLDINSFFLSSHMLMIMLMFIGGSPGSTAGGIKTSTFALLWIAILSRLRGKRDSEIFERRIPDSDMFMALTIVLMYVVTLITMSFLFILSHQQDFLPVMFEMTSALGTVGLSLGLTPSHTPLEQILVIITMFLGRVGPLTLGFALAHNRTRPLIRYPEGKIMIG
ncbi:MAG: Trk family potassium uptake protein [Syntrophomonadaceae bacterium]|nr:Trk family potassium uptake protein [Syntrophomonadaceae bacterium]